MNEMLERSWSESEYMVRTQRRRKCSGQSRRRTDALMGRMADVRRNRSPRPGVEHDGLGWRAQVVAGRAAMSPPDAPLVSAAGRLERGISKSSQQSANERGKQTHLLHYEAPSARPRARQS